MNPRRILMALSLALLVSGLSTWFVSRKITAPSTQKTLEVMYAAPSRAIQVGEVLRADNTELVPWPRSFPLEGAFSRTADVIGRGALLPLQKGQPVLDLNLSARGAGTGLANKIPNGLRAVALRSDEVVGVAGFLIPGSHLDVLVTYRSANSPDPITATVLQNVVVIAAGHQSEPDPEGKSSDVAIVTLLLTPGESQRAVLASTQGAIHFVLRNGGDSSVSSEAPVQLSQLAGTPRGSEHAAKRPLPALVVQAPKPHEVEMVFGGDSGGSRQTATHAGGAGQ